VSAGVIAVAAALWLASGELREPRQTGPKTLAEQNARLDAAREDRPLTRVRARVVRAEPQTEHVTLRGWTANKRTVQVKAETSGRVAARPVEKGQRVTVGQLLCRISIDDREARVAEATEAVNQARIEYEGALKLQARGLVSETLVATSKARLAAAQAQLARSELEAKHTIVRAPFAGLVEDTHVEVGTFVQPGTPCATVIDLDPMLLVGRISERDVHAVMLGGVAEGRLLSGERVTGKVTFVGKQSDPSTRTYPVEVEVPNPDYTLRSGITTEIFVSVGTGLAHKVSPSLLALDDEGRIGLRTLDENNQVEFHHVEIIADDAGSVWVSGLPEVATVITVGQELVVPGERVDVTFEAGSAQPIAVPRNNTQGAAENLAGESPVQGRATQATVEVGTG
jgi:multidrug efflux system membrane fusion protein